MCQLSKEVMFFITSFLYVNVKNNIKRVNPPGDEHFLCEQKTYWKCK